MLLILNAEIADKAVGLNDDEGDVVLRTGGGELQEDTLVLEESLRMRKEISKLGRGSTSSEATIMV